MIAIRSNLSLLQAWNLEIKPMHDQILVDQPVIMIYKVVSRSHMQSALERRRQQRPRFPILLEF
jgi:hypothetical protein